MDQDITGFDQLSQAVKQLYPNQDGIYYRSIIPAQMGGDSPLEGVEVWESNHQIPHWHYITYGYTELYEKQTDEPEVSGFGFEMTFRLKKGEESSAPVWPINLLKNLANYVFSSGNAFDTGHHINCNGPIALDEETDLTALFFTEDKELPPMKTMNGAMKFLQAVAITNDEMEALMCWNGEKFVGLMEKENPLLITDLQRTSKMTQPDFVAAWEKGVEEDGSSTGFLYMDEMDVVEQDGKYSLILGAGHIDTFTRMIHARVGKGKELLIQSEEMIVCFQPLEHPIVEKEDGLFIFDLSTEALKEIQTVLQPKAGKYLLPSAPMNIELTLTQIRDAEGNIVETIG